MIIKNYCEVDFRRCNSINSLLGFDSKLYTSGFNESENMVNILTTTSILVNIDIISGSYVNGFTQPTIYSFFPVISPGYKSIEYPHNLLYLPITAHTIHSIAIWVKDQNETSLTYEERILSMRFHLREIILRLKDDTLHQCYNANIRGSKRQAQESI